ncbi:HalOD1 output domain-containing protein [Natronobacterium gregoryi]|uniref:Halobacterial output domain-containing protein n=2 Tax=Natronobacterium gregoryi TaxID=44930 RepID=L0AIA6_NATGS|nr:HalOD1 output domain-containing protein [Natronobacterium gregoryi]AFZ73603.1 hypothetical protein Natgr_2435 [Natronobacterium gregoryi SP2]ELY67883.1 hypothetical protein C490_10325 [Natronobacterium gregoryi SP2]PLK20010.1 hypothetical protein CYV19_11870 [Natronobacterium gregoryi SP2]SFJ34612.1 hypothetical protein SAMN05443661_12336 [Natronobacterium gregoryi]
MHPALITALERIAACEDRDPTALPPLYRAVDPEALTALLESPAAVTARFEYAGYEVVIGPGPIEVAVLETRQ